MQTKAAMTENQLDQLRRIRANPRLMRESSLRAAGLFDAIMEATPDASFVGFKTKERIDYIIGGCVDSFCYCGKRTKLFAKYCSRSCTGKSPEVRTKLSSAQTNNAAERITKSRQTMMQRYGVIHNNHLSSCKESRANKREEWAEKTRMATFAKYGLDIEEFNTKEKVTPLIDNCVSFNELRTKHFGGMPAMTLFRYLRDKLGIESFYEKTSSGAEREIRKFLEELGVIDCIYNSRKVLPSGLELDMYSKKHKLAIEYHGLYWHSGIKGKTAHKQKYTEAKELGIRLIQIFEDEWLYKQEIVKSILKSKLGHSKKLYARKCKVRVLTAQEANEFYDNNHLQGKIAGKHVGLFFDDLLVSAVSIGKSRFRNKEANFELLRYASLINHTVVGGFSKLMAFVRSNITAEPILTYCDLRYSSGETYSKFGVYIRDTAPGYFWANFNNCIRVNRYMTQKSKLASIIGKNYDASKTERENMELSGHALVWDCGHAVYTID